MTVIDWIGRALCVGRTEWTSSDLATRVAAARACMACPVRDACRDYADEIKASAGVWAGRDRGICAACGGKKQVLHRATCTACQQKT